MAEARKQNEIKTADNNAISISINATADVEKDANGKSTKIILRTA